VRFSIAARTQHVWHTLKRYRTLCAHFFVFACSTLLTRGISIVFAPIAMRLLSPADYGLIALAQSFISILSACLGLGLRQALPMFYFQKDAHEKSIFICDIIAMYLVCALPALVLLSTQIAHINAWVFLQASSYSVVMLCFAIAFLFFFVELVYQLLRLEQQAKTLTIIQLMVTIVTIACNLFFLYHLNWGACSLLAGQLLGMCVACISGVWLCSTIACRPTMQIKRSMRFMRTYIGYGLPFIPSMLFGMLLASGDRWVLAYMAGMHEVGIYSLANTLTQLVNMMILYAMMGSYIPHVLKQFHDPNADVAAIERDNKKVMWFCMVALFALLCIGFLSAKTVLYRIIPSTYHEAVDYMGLLLIGTIFYLGTHFLNCLLLHQKKSAFLGAVLLVPAIGNVLLNMLFVPYCAIYGCVLATTMSYAGYFCLTLWYNHRLLRSATHAQSPHTDAAHHQP